MNLVVLVFEKKTKGSGLNYHFYVPNFMLDNNGTLQKFPASLN